MSENIQIRVDDAGHYVEVKTNEVGFTSEEQEMVTKIEEEQESIAGKIRSLIMSVADAATIEDDLNAVLKSVYAYPLGGLEGDADINEGKVAGIGQWNTKWRLEVHFPTSKDNAYYDLAEVVLRAISALTKEKWQAMEKNIDGQYLVDVRGSQDLLKLAQAYARWGALQAKTSEEDLKDLELQKHPITKKLFFWGKPEDADNPDKNPEGLEVMHPEDRIITLKSIKKARAMEEVVRCAEASVKSGARTR